MENIIFNVYLNNRILKKLYVFIGNLSSKEINDLNSYKFSNYISKYKDYILQNELDDFNDDEDIEIIKLNTHKIDGSLLCISKNIPTPFIAPEMHFVREDTCASIFFQVKQIPQYHITNRLKGHNYWHPQKRTNTEATRNDNIFKHYADLSQQSMNKFLQNL